MDGVRAADRRGGGLREAEVADLPLADELGHRADGLLDRDRPVDAVLVVEVDRLDAEPLQRAVAAGADVLRPAVDAEEGALRVAHVPELRREDDLVAPLPDRAADELLVLPGAVHVGGVEERDAEVERAVDRGDRLGVVAPGVELRHPHAAEPLGGDDEALAAERAGFHGGPPARL